MLIFLLSSANTFLIVWAGPEARPGDFCHLLLRLNQRWAKPLQTLHCARVQSHLNSGCSSQNWLRLLFVPPVLLPKASPTQSGDVDTREHAHWSTGGLALHAAYPMRCQKRWHGNQRPAHISACGWATDQELFHGFFEADGTIQTAQEGVFTNGRTCYIHGSGHSHGMEGKTLTPWWGRRSQPPFSSRVLRDAIHLLWICYERVVWQTY